MKAVYAGSFDPITNGHLNLIKRASKLFDELIVLISVNLEKKYFFEYYERLTMVKQAVEELGLTNVSVHACNGLTVDFATSLGAEYLIRGLRSVTDFEYEIQLSTINKNISKNIETIFIPCDPTLASVSSSMVRELEKYNADISEYVPKCVIDGYKKHRDPLGLNK